MQFHYIYDGWMDAIEVLILIYICDDIH